MTIMEREIVRIGAIITDKGYASEYCIQGRNCEPTFLEALFSHVVRNKENAFPVTLTGAVGDLPGSTALFAGIVVAMEKDRLRITDLKLSYRDHEDSLIHHQLPIKRVADLPTVQSARVLMLNLYEQLIGRNKRKSRRNRL